MPLFLYLLLMELYNLTFLGKCIYSCMQQERRKPNGHFIYSTNEIETVENIRHLNKGKKAYGCVDHEEILSLSFHAPLEAPSAKNLMTLNQ